MFEDETPAEEPPATILKKTILHFDVPVTEVVSIETYFGSDMPTESRAFLRDAHSTRNEFIAALRSNDPDMILAVGEKHVGNMMRVLSTESLLDAEERNVVIHRLKSFTWSSVLDNNARSGRWHKNGAFVDVTFTLVAMACAHFNAAHRDIESDVNEAYKHVRIASGIFTAAASTVKMHREHLETQGGLDPMELKMAVLEGMADLALAQAQQCMLWKAESEKKRPAILAKLAKGTASLYHKAINHFRTGLGPGMAARIMETMGAMEDTCNALAHKYMALQSTADDAYGAAVWHGRKSNQMMQTVLRHTLTVEELLMAVKEEAANIAALAETAESDNGTIYFEPVPSDNEVAPVVGPVLAKPVPFETHKEWREIVAVPEDKAPPPPPPARSSGGGKVEEGVVEAKLPRAPAGKSEMRFACSRCSNVVVAAVGTMSIQCPHCKRVNVCIACGACDKVFSCLRTSDKVKCPSCLATNHISV